MRTIWKRRVLLGAILISYAAFLASTLWQTSATTDEYAHYQYGINMLSFDSDRFDDSKMPVSIINAAAAEAFSLVLGTGDPNPLLDLNAARSGTIAFAVLLALLVFCWSRELFGWRGAGVSLFLFVFSPTIIAHGRLVTTDLYAAFSQTLACYCFWKLLRDRSPRWLVAAALSFAVCFLCKYSAVFLLPAFAVLLALHCRFRKEDSARPTLRNMGILLLAYGLALLFVINVGFLMNRSFLRLDQYSFKSSIMAQAQQIPVVRALPVPFPYPFLEGLDRVKYREETGFGWGNLYLLGEWRRGDAELKGFPGYFIIAFLLKVPLAAIAIMVWSGICMCRRFRRDYMFLLIPLVVYFGYFNFLFNAQMGIRFILPVFPLLHVLCGAVAPVDKPFPRPVLALLACLCASVLSYYPNYIPYFNELMPDRKLHYRALADSNLDWGQAKGIARRFLQENTDVQMAPADPRPGRFLIRVNDLVGIDEGTKPSWLLQYKPVRHVGHAYLLFEIPDLSLHKLDK